VEAAAFSRKIMTPVRISILLRENTSLLPHPEPGTGNALTL
jgi:hypothetical protein